MTRRKAASVTSAIGANTKSGFGNFFQKFFSIWTDYHIVLSYVSPEARLLPLSLMALHYFRYPSFIKYLGINDNLVASFQFSSNKFSGDILFNVLLNRPIKRTRSKFRISPLLDKKVEKVRSDHQLKPLKQETVRKFIKKKAGNFFKMLFP